MYIHIYTYRPLTAEPSPRITSSLTPPPPPRSWQAFQQNYEALVRGDDGLLRSHPIISI